MQHGSGPGQPRALRVLYITMQFPIPSEAFAAVEISALCRAGAYVAIECMRPRPLNCAALLDERQLDALPLGHNSVNASLRGLLYGLAQPGILLHLLALVIRHGATKPVHLLRGLVLVPRILDIFAKVQRERPDVVHLFWGHYPSLLGLLIERYIPSTVVSLFLGAYDLVRDYPGSAELARRVPMVWTHTEANRPAIARLGAEPSRIEVCYRGIELQRADGDSDTIVPGRVVVIGRLDRSKYTAEAVMVFAGLLERFPNASLEILGDGPERPALIHLVEQLGISDAVRFLGHINHENVFDHLAAAAVLLSMSRCPTERLPNAVKEAMLQRCVPVVTWTEGIEELVTDGVDGFVVPQGDIAAAVERASQVLASPAIRDALAERGRTKMIEAFDVDRLTQRRLEVWCRLVSLRRNRGPERRQGEFRPSSTDHTRK